MANLPLCSDDEMRVIDCFVQRIHNARREYGPLRMKRDTRDYRHEAAAEAFDACFYLCLEDVRRGVESQEPRFSDPTKTTCANCGLAQGHTLECCYAQIAADQARENAAAERVRTILKQREG